MIILKSSKRNQILCEEYVMNWASENEIKCKDFKNFVKLSNINLNKTATQIYYQSLTHYCPVFFFMPTENMRKP